MGRVPGPSAVRDGEGARRFRRCAFVSLLAPAALLPALAAAAQDRPVEAVPLERLRFEYKCYFQVPEWKGRGEDRFLARLRAQREAHRASAAERVPDVEDLLADALWSRKAELEAKSEMDGASAFANEILSLDSEKGRVGELKPQADEFIIGRQFAKAAEFKKAGNFTKAKESYVLCLRTRRTEVRDQIIGEVVGMERVQSGYDKLEGGDDFAAEGSALERLLQSLEAAFPREVYALDHPALKSLKDRGAEIQKTTQVVTVGGLDASEAVKGVKGAVATVELARAGFAFEPVEGGRRFPAKGRDGRLPASGALRLIRGLYDVRVYAPDAGDRPYAVFLGVDLREQPASFRVPDRAPEGMVYVGPWKDGGGFYMDRTEVTVAQVTQVAGSDPLLTGPKSVLAESNKGPADPAWFFNEESVLAYEKASGKRIPTKDQWIQAAFGPRAARWPWGKDSPTADTVFADDKAPEPRPAGQRPRGASPYGMEDMAGNVAEWVRVGKDLWLLGGHYLLGYKGLESLDGKNPLREPQPGAVAFGAMNRDDQNRFFKYKFDETLFYASGVRMVLNVESR